MAAETQRAQETDGAALARTLEAHHTFLKNVYGLVKFLESEVTKQGWELVKPNGFYGVTYNDIGEGLEVFHWSLNQIGIGFVRRGAETPDAGAAATLIPEEGLEVRAFQVRWLDKSPEQPVVWRVKLRVRPAAESPTPVKWDDCQKAVLRKWQAAEPNGATSGDLKPDTVTVSPKSGRFSVSFDGTYDEIPVAKLLTEEDVIRLLIPPTSSE